MSKAGKIVYLLILKDYLQCNLVVLQPFEDFDKLQSLA